MKFMQTLFLILCSGASLLAMEQTKNANNQIISLLNNTGHTLLLKCDEETYRGKGEGWEVSTAKTYEIDKNKKFELYIGRNEEGKKVHRDNATLRYKNAKLITGEIKLPLELIKSESQGQDAILPIKAGFGDLNIVLDFDNMIIAQEAPSALEKLRVNNNTINYNLFVRYISKRETEKKQAESVTHRYPIEKSVITVITPGDSYPIIISKEITNEKLTKRTSVNKIEVAFAFDDEKTNNQYIADPAKVTGWLELPLHRIKRIAFNSEEADLPIQKKSGFLTTELDVDLKSIQTYNEQ